MPFVSSLHVDQTTSSRPAETRHYRRQVMYSVACWTGIIILESSQVCVSDVAEGRVFQFIHYLAWATFNWFAFALFTPLIYELGRRYPVAGSNWAARIVFPHLIACLACLLTQATCRGVSGWLYTITHETLASPTSLAAEWIEKRGMLGFIAYWLIVVIAGFAQLREEVRQREIHRVELETRLASSELEKLRMQIQPHFLFNTLQAAVTLVQVDPRAAEDVLLRLSQLLRISLDQMDADEIPLARELELLDLYIGIQRRRFGERLSVAIHSDSALLNLPVPPLILQPLVENAIRHGIEKHKGPDCIEIFARQQDHELQIEVWNTNSIVDQTSASLFQRGVGLRNTKARLEQLYGPTASFILRPLARGGAAAIIVIPARVVSRAKLDSPAEVAS
jgi:two-component system, LytTR family, sensor kinase